jgi:GNAT superfamily N-acetyltransferase
MISTMQVPGSDAELAVLLKAMNDDMLARYGVPDLGPPRLEPGVRFLAAMEDGASVGCVGVQAFTYGDGAPGVFELKRMYVRPEARRKGVSRALLAAAEELARGLGARRMMLETGTAQPEAMALYAASGYEPAEPYGPFAHVSVMRYFTKEF